MRIACSLGSLLSVNQVLKCSEIISKTNVDTIWIPETWGMENFSMLSAVSNKTTTQKIGSSIINIYSRSPALIAMGAATVDTLSNERLILGLGTSSLPVVETFHGYKFEKPVQIITSLTPYFFRYFICHSIIGVFITGTSDFGT